MEENIENIDLVIRIVDSNIVIKVPRKRSTDYVKTYLPFIAKSHLSKVLGEDQATITSDNSFVAFDPPGKYSNSLDDSDGINFHQLTGKLAGVTLLLTKRP